MPKKLTCKEYVDRVNEINPNIDVLGEYIGTNIKILHRCKIDGYEWYATPNSVLNGHGCPMCYYNKNKKTTEEYIQEVAKLNPDIEVIGQYIGAKTKILHRCKIDNHEWMATPSNILQGTGCPECKKRNLEITHEEYVKKAFDVNPDVEVVGKYCGSAIKILHRCKIDGYEWMVRPHNILFGRGCPKCTLSKGEKIITSWLNSNDIYYEAQKTFEDCKDKRVLPFDFYLPNYNILIEYNGKQHYEPVDYFGGQKAFEAQVLRDNIKREYCQKNNILLFEIPYYSDLDEELSRLYDLIKRKEVVA